MEYPKIRIIGKDENEITIDSSQLMDMASYELTLRNQGRLEGKAIFLPWFINGEKVDKWIIIEESDTGNVCAVPLKK